MHLIFSRKDKPVGHIFGAGFTWPEAVDAAANIYNGVGTEWRGIPGVATLIICIVRLLVNADVPRAYCMV